MLSSCIYRLYLSQIWKWQFSLKFVLVFNLRFEKATILQTILFSDNHREAKMPNKGTDSKCGIRAQSSETYFACRTIYVKRKKDTSEKSAVPLKYTIYALHLSHKIFMHVDMCVWLVWKCERTIFDGNKQYPYINFSFRVHEFDLPKITIAFCYCYCCWYFWFVVKAEWLLYAL